MGNNKLPERKAGGSMLTLSVLNDKSSKADEGFTELAKRINP